MRVKDEQVLASIAEQASEWFVANDDAPLNAPDSAAFVAWLRASPLNVAEFLGVAELARDLHALGADAGSSLDELIERARSERDLPASASARFRLLPVGGLGWHLAAVASVLLILSGGMALWFARTTRVAPVTAPLEALKFQTGHGEQRTYRLPDDSLLHLNTDSRVTVQFSPTQRLVVLVAGEAAFAVNHEVKRTFRVLAGPAEIVDLGTRFDVRLLPDTGVVTVVEGRVAVASAGSRTADASPVPAMILGANQQISVIAGQSPTAPQSVDAERVTAWLHRQIVFEREPLQRVAAEFNRYAPKPIDIVAPDLRDLEVSGSFSTDDMEEFLAFLRSLEGVRVDVTETEVRVSRK